MLPEYSTIKYIYNEVTLLSKYAILRSFQAITRYQNISQSTRLSEKTTKLSALDNARLQSYTTTGKYCATAIRISNLEL